MELFATAAKGTEPALRDELREMRQRGVRADRGGVHFEGGWEAGWEACMRSRVAFRVLAKLSTFEAASEAALYAGVRAIDFTPYLDPKHTLAVSASLRSSRLTHSGYVALKTKDAIVDGLRDHFGSRPDVDRDDPDVAVFVHLAKDVATVYVDLAGDSLHKRGYRQGRIEAPIKETLAAAVVRLSGWDRKRTLCDPMCGSGTIAIEADLVARRVAPALERRFGFERWTMHDETMREKLAALRESTRARQLADGPPVIASDVDESAIALARENARRAGAHVEFRVAPVQELEPLEPPAQIVTNPPYDERMAADQALVDDVAFALSGLAGHRVAILTADPRLERAMEVRPVERRQLFNGDIECALLLYELR